MEKSQKHGNKVILVGDGAVGSSYAYALVLQGLRKNLESLISISKKQKAMR